MGQKLLSDDATQADLEENLKPKLTDDFLSTLAQAVRTCGDIVDHIASVDFVNWCFRLAGKEPPELAPFVDW